MQCSKYTNLSDESKAGSNIENIDEALDFSYNSPIYKEFLDFIKSRKNKSVLYAYSGGLDSTVVLFLLNNLCKENKIKLNTFTMNNGFKGEKTWNNIKNVIKFLNIEENYEIYDIRKNIVTDEEILSRFGNGNTVEEIYSLAILNDILPCGKVCNTIMDNKYKEILKAKEEEYLITGGDTPKVRNNKYSVIWYKKNGLKIVRGAAGFRLNKNLVKQLLKENNIPWENPNYGGYDTDCLIPGTILASKNNGNQTINIYEIIEKYPVVFEYLKERLRLNIIDRKTSLCDLNNLDINTFSGYIEANKTAVKVLKRRINNNVQIK